MALVVVLVVLVCQCTALFPSLVRRSLGTAPCLRERLARVEELVASSDMLARTAQVFLDVPFDAFADYLMSPLLLPTWNADYSRGGTEAALTPCTKFTASFTTQINVTVPRGFSFKPPLVLTVNRTRDVALFGWDFGVSDDRGVDYYYGAHWIGAFRERVNDRDAVHFISWEKMTSGPNNTFVRDNMAAFESGMSLTVLQPDLVGAMCLERAWNAAAVLEPRAVAKLCSKSAV